MRPRGVDSAIAALETSSLPWGYWLATFLGIVIARNLLEGAFGPDRILGFVYQMSPSALMVLDHFLFFYASVFLSIAIVLSVLARESIGRVARVMTPAFAIILIPPALDYLLTSGQGVRITYVLELRPVILGFFDPRAALQGVSAGQRIEIVLACVLGAAYARTKTGSWARAAGAFVGVYLAIAALGRSDLEELRSTGKSAMPDGLERELKHQDVADLIAYLRGGGR